MSPMKPIILVPTGVNIRICVYNFGTNTCLTSSGPNRSYGNTIIRGLQVWSLMSQCFTYLFVYLFLFFISQMEPIILALTGVKFHVFTTLALTYACLVPTGRMVISSIGWPKVWSLQVAPSIHICVFQFWF